MKANIQSPTSFYTTVALECEEEVGMYRPFHVGVVSYGVGQLFATHHRTQYLNAKV